MKRLSLLLWTILLLPAPVHADLAGGLRAGTTGLGAELYWPLSDRVNLRAIAAGWEYNEGLDEAGVSYDAEQTLASAGLVADWHPDGGKLRFSAGLMLNGNGTDLDSACQPSCTVGGSRITPLADDPGRITGELDYGGGASYFSVGWVSATRLSRWFWSAEAGLMLQSKPESRLQASGSFVSSSSGELLSATEVSTLLQAEQLELDEALDSRSLVPVLSLGLGFRF